MKRIYVRKPGQEIGRVYKSHKSIANDKVAILSFIGFVTTVYITEAEHAKSQQTIVDKFQLYVAESEMDGRGKVAKNTPFFSWAEVIKSNHQIKAIR